jgi:NitT/TauT family transport system substrate-binding protein
MAAGQPKPAFYIVVGVVVVALIGFAIWKSDVFAPKAKSTGKEFDVHVEKTPPDTKPADFKPPDYVPAQRLPEVKEVSKYKPMQGRTVKFAVNVWAGWAPIILANDGFKSGKIWKAGDGKAGDDKDFKVELVLIDDPVQMRDAYASGDIHIGWATVDMLPLFMESFVDKSGKPRDTRIMPRVYQQIDWSNGGDGIVVRDEIKTTSDLRGKKLVLTQNSPSHFFALNMLVYGGVQPSEVKTVFTADPFKAADAFNADKSVAGAVSWSPNIYELAKVKGNHMLVTTSDANKLIADTWFARADFAKDNPEIIEGLVRGIFDSISDLQNKDKSEATRKHAAGLMAKGYNIPEADALGMLGDAHNTNWAENYQFLMNQNNPSNFEAIWDRAYYLYGRIGTVTHQKVAADQVLDFSVVDKLGKEEKYSAQKDAYTSKFVQKSSSEIKQDVENPILTNTVQIKFYSNSWDLHKKITRQVDGKTVEELYDPNVDLVLDEIAKLAGQFGNAYIVIEGHTDSSYKGQVPPALVKELSLNRANAVKDALLEKYPKLDGRRFAVEGAGWDRPADPNDPNNQAKNRRVEVKVYSAEKQ